MNDVTRILSDINHGDPQAAEQLLRMVYDKRRKPAAQRLAHKRLGRPSRPPLSSTSRTGGWSAGMRPGSGIVAVTSSQGRPRPCVSSSSTTPAARGSSSGAFELERQPLDDTVALQPDDELLALDEALPTLATTDPVKARLVELRYFAGLTGEQAARYSVSRRPRRTAIGRSRKRGCVTRSGGLKAKAFSPFRGSVRLSPPVSALEIMEATALVGGIAPRPGSLDSLSVGPGALADFDLPHS